MNENLIPMVDMARNARCMFEPAERLSVPIRAGIAGPTGSGKTLGALRMAYGMTGNWSKIFFINTEPLANGYGYVGDPIWNIGQFMFYQLDAPHHPDKYLRAMRNAVDSGAGVIIVDTFSNVWAGRDGVRDIHDAMTGNPWANWSKVNPLWYGLMDYINYDCPVHLILTLRSQLKYVQDEVIDGGQKKSVINLLGMAPIMRPETEYEFPLFLQVDRATHRAEIVTMRGSMLQSLDPITNSIELTETVGSELVEWAERGAAYLPPKRPKNLEPKTAPATPAPDRKNGKSAPIVHGMAATEFWPVVYNWAHKPQLGRVNARSVALELLEKHGGQSAPVLIELALQWNISPELIAKDLVGMFRTYTATAKFKPGRELLAKIPSDAEPGPALPTPAPDQETE